MELKLGLIADAANISQEGKLNILGQFTNINVQSSFPIRWPSMVLVLNIEGHINDLHKKHKFLIRGVDQDGTEFLNIEGQFNLAPAEDPALPPKVGTIIALQDLVFPNAGIYDFEVIVNDRFLNSIPLIVVDRIQAK